MLQTRKPLVSTTAPMPALSALLAPHGAAGLDDATLSVPWRKPGDRAVFLGRASWALRAIAEGHALTDQKPPRLWVPDYFCDSALTALRNAPAEIIFYPVTESFEPDWAACASLAAEVPPKLFLQVHYFGWARDLRPAREFCNSHRAKLIEDAAHALIPSAAIGGYGDYTVWSLYKHLPSPDGGLLVVRDSGKAGSEVLRVASTFASRQAASPTLWRLRRLAQALCPRLAGHLRPQFLPFDADPSAGSVPASAISDFARRLISMGLQDLSAIALARHMNERALREALRNCSGLRPAFVEPAPDQPPYRAVFCAESAATARRWYERIVASGNVAETWPDLPAEVRATPHRHSVALHLRATYLCLPIHADRTAHDLASAYGAACA